MGIIHTIFHIFVNNFFFVLNFQRCFTLLQNLIIYNKLLQIIYNESMWKISLIKIWKIFCTH